MFRWYKYKNHTHERYLIESWPSDDFVHVHLYFMRPRAWLSYRWHRIVVYCWRLWYNHKTKWIRNTDRRWDKIDAITGFLGNMFFEDQNQVRAWKRSQPPRHLHYSDGAVKERETSET